MEVDRNILDLLPDRQVAVSDRVEVQITHRFQDCHIKFRGSFIFRIVVVETLHRNLNRAVLILLQREEGDLARLRIYEEVARSLHLVCCILSRVALGNVLTHLVRLLRPERRVGHRSLPILRGGNWGGLNRCSFTRGSRFWLVVEVIGFGFRSDLNRCVDGFFGTIRVAHHDWNRVVTRLGILRRLDLDRSIRVNRDPLRLVDLVALWVSHLTGLLEGGSPRDVLAVLVLRCFHGGLLTGRSSSVLILRLEFTVLAVLVDRDEGVLTNDDVVCINKLCDIGARSCEIFRSQGAVSSVRQGVNRAVVTNLLAVRTDPTDLVITRERQRARQLDLRRLEVADAFRKVCRVEVGIVIKDVQISDLGLNLSEVDVVPAVTGMTRDTDITAPVRVLTRIAVYLLEDGRREATEGVENLAVVLRPDVGVILDAVADTVTHTDGVAAFGIGNSANGLKDRLLAVRTHVLDHGLRGGSLLTKRLIGDC